MVCRPFQVPYKYKAVETARPADYAKVLTIVLGEVVHHVLRKLLELLRVSAFDWIQCPLVLILERLHISTVTQSNAGPRPPVTRRHRSAARRANCIQMRLPYLVRIDQGQQMEVIGPITLISK